MPRRRAEFTVRGPAALELAPAADRQRQRLAIHLAEPDAPGIDATMYLRVNKMPVHCTVLMADSRRAP